MRGVAEDYNVRGERAIEARNCVGSIWKPFGADGHLVVKMWDMFPQNNEEPLWVVMDSLPVPLFIVERQSQGASKCVVVFEDFETRERAQMLIGRELYCEGVDVDEEEKKELELVGYTFVDAASGRKGEVVGFLDSDFNPLLEVKLADSDDEVLVPLADDLIKSVDDKRRVLTMSLPGGLLNIDQEEE